MSGNPQTIELLAGTAGCFLHSAAIAAAGSAIVPGMLVELTTAGTVQEHSTAGDTAEKAFALPDLPVAGDIDTAYAVGAQVRYGVARSGQEAYAWVSAGASAIAIGRALESAGDGALQPTATDAATDDTQRNAIVGYALEAVDNSGGGSPVRIRVRVA